jgi:hydroxymethylbilane synthase
LLKITTSADRQLQLSLAAMGGKGVFVKELEEALLDGRADIAVHSMKDVPMVLPEGLNLVCMLKREDPQDVFISNRFQSLDLLPRGAVVGTSSLRRQTQLLALRPDLIFKSLRGNVETRLKALDEGQFDAIILAAAGLNRLQLASRISSYLAPEVMLPAAGQGALGIECRSEDYSVIKLIQPLNDQETADCVIAERAMCRRLGGGCQVPVAAFAKIYHDVLHLRGLVAGAMGKKVLMSELSGPRASANSMGIALAENLLKQGAAQLLKEFYEHQST